VTVIRGDARALPLASSSVDAVVTSPPYLEQRTYGPDGNELGHEGGLDAYVAALADVFDEVRRVLKPDGLAWLNIGDKANGSGGAGGDWTRGTRTRRDPMDGAKRFFDRDYPDRSFLDVPGAVVHELLRRGWRLRLPIVWNKLREAPESLKHAGRPRWAHEMIFLLAPTPQRPRFYPSLLEETGSVWSFRSGSSGPAHLAPFPDELARRCILPSTLPGDLVLDPFDGSGTVRRVAAELGRRAVGVDLYAGTGALDLELDGKRSLRGKARRTVDLEDLRKIELRPAVLYYASRLLREGRTLETVALELKLTPEQIAYVDELTRPEETAS
jgi:site-specific DNA-methyltransferase (cytosine-N4-specific)